MIVCNIIGMVFPYCNNIFSHLILEVCFPIAIVEINLLSTRIRKFWTFPRTYGYLYTHVGLDLN